MRTSGPASGHTGGRERKRKGGKGGEKELGVGEGERERENVHALGEKNFEL